MKKVFGDFLSFFDVIKTVKKSMESAPFLKFQRDRNSHKRKNRMQKKKKKKNTGNNLDFSPHAFIIGTYG